MSIELESKCSEYNVSNAGRQMIKNLEKMFDIAIERQGNEENGISMCKYIEKCTDWLVGFSEEQRFFFGIGILVDDVSEQANFEELIQ